MTNSCETVAERFERKNKELQRRMLALPGSQRDLRTLIKAGAHETKVLELLYLAVIERGSWKKPMRRKKRELESFANQLETLARRAERISLDPSSYGTLWLAVLDGNFKYVRPASERSPTAIFGLMRAYAKNCRDRAQAFGSLLRTYPPEENRRAIDCLLLEVWMSTGRYHDKEVARLLTNALEAVGSEKQFTTDQIKKHRQKHVVPRIKIYKSLHPASALVAENGKTGTP
jgi:hypothetical protein